MTAQEREMLLLFRTLNDTGQQETLHLLQWFATRKEYRRQKQGSAQILPFRINTAQSGNAPRSRHE